MANETVKTSFSVSIGVEDSSYTPSASIDTRERADGGFNARFNARTSGFKPGDTIYFLVYVGESFKVTSVKTSAGSATKASVTPNPQYIDVEPEQITFAEGRASTGSLGNSAPTILTQKYFGADVCGVLTLGTDSISVSPQPMPAISLNASESVIAAQQAPFIVPCIAEVTYKTKVEVWALKTPTAQQVAAALAPKTTGSYPIHVAIDCDLV